MALAKKSVSGDAGSFDRQDADDVLKLNAAAAGADALDGTNANGGPRSAFNLLRPARASFPGAYR
jgi:hypothetical protein